LCPTYFDDVRLAYILLVDGQFGVDSFWITFIPCIAFLFPPIAWVSIKE
jgi:hypothetical protein